MGFPEWIQSKTCNFAQFFSAHTLDSVSCSPQIADHERNNYNNNNNKQRWPLAALASLHTLRPTYGRPQHAQC